MLENNPEYFFENSNVLIIGRQVTTNLGKSIDLLGIDKYGNTVVIELKRDKTPRDVIAQLLEYASFVEKLDYQQLDEIYKSYSDDGLSLEERHQQYFERENEQVSFNKEMKLVIVAEDISKEIKQVAGYLRDKGIDICCLEFKYFLNSLNEKIISSDFVVGDDNFIKQKVILSSKSKKINKQEFFELLDEYGKIVYNKIFSYTEKENITPSFAKGISFIVKINKNRIVLFYGYPRFIYAEFKSIREKVNNSEKIIDFYKSELQKLNCFEPAGNLLKWTISNTADTQKVDNFIEILKQVVSQIKQEG